MKTKNSSRWRRTLAVIAAGTMLANSSLAFANVVASPTKTPIKHVVVIFGENISFDHYFATYPQADNPSGEPRFIARDDTPPVNGLSPDMLTNNPNLKQPFRLDRAEAYTCSQDHNYTDEQKAVDGGLMDQFVQATAHVGVGCRTDGSTVMAYYDGNTVTALWNYAQRFAMDDNSFGTTYGPSSVGAVNLISGQTGNGLLALTFAQGKVATSAPVTMTGDPDPALDDCGADKGGTVTGKGTVEMTGKNIGDLLNEKHITWGWFEGGFAPTKAATINADGSTASPAVCGAAHIAHEYVPAGATKPVFVVPNPTAQDGNPGGTDIHVSTADYVPHHEPFQYYASTRNPHHLRPSPDVPQQIGKSDQANHQYDMADFFNALQHGNLPAVSYLKAPAYEDGHPGNSDPLTEQVFVVQVLNALQSSPFWKETAVIISYDDSDGWYDHVPGPVVSASASLGLANGGNNSSTNANDALIPVLPLSSSTSPAAPGNITTSGVCGKPSGSALSSRCGYGPRLPFMVLSPWAKQNFVDHTLTDQTSSLRFIEDNWSLGSVDGNTTPPAGQASFDHIAGSILNMFDFDDAPNMQPLLLDEITGQVVGNHAGGGDDGRGDGHGHGHGDGDGHGDDHGHWNG